MLYLVNSKFDHCFIHRHCCPVRNIFLCWIVLIGGWRNEFQMTYSSSVWIPRFVTILSRWRMKWNDSRFIDPFWGDTTGRFPLTYLRFCLCFFIIIKCHIICYILRTYLTVVNTAYVWWHNDVIKRKHFPRYWPFVRGIHRWPVNSPHKGQWCGALMFSLICAWTDDRVNNRDAGDFRLNRAHYDVTVLYLLNMNLIRIMWPIYWQIQNCHEGLVTLTPHCFGPFYLHGLTLIQAWINHYIHYEAWDEIIYPFLNFNGA